MSTSPVYLWFSEDMLHVISCSFFFLVVLALFPSQRLSSCHYSDSTDFFFTVFHPSMMAGFEGRLVN